VEFDAERCIWQYGDVVVDPLQRRLIRKGVVIDVEQRAFDLIVLLAARRGQAVDRREITAALWGPRPVGENALRQVVYKARRALADDGARQVAIRTMHGRSLRWVAPIAPVQSAEPLLFAQRSRISLRVFACLALAALVGGAVPAPSGTRVAILPIENATGKSALDWTRKGLPTLIADLLDDDNVVVVELAAQPTDSAKSPVQIVVDGQLRKVSGSAYELDLEVRGPAGDETRIDVRGEWPGALAVDVVPRLRHVLRM
jgi:DNA-binding winged helix-turn-helix (wHTH) protein